MQIRIERTKESTKGMLSGKNWRLVSKISTTLSGEEQSLVKEYFDPSVDVSKVSLPIHRNEPKEIYEPVDVEVKSDKLSKFDIMASIKDHKYLGPLQHYEEVVIDQLTIELNHLRNLAVWEGKKELTM